MTPRHPNGKIHSSRFSRHGLVLVYEVPQMHENNVAAPAWYLSGSRPVAHACGRNFVSKKVGDEGLQVEVKFRPLFVAIKFEWRGASYEHQPKSRPRRCAEIAPLLLFRIGRCCHKVPCR